MRRWSGPDRGTIDWRLPCREAVRHIIRHPIYTGAYIYGFRPADPRRREPGHPKGGRSSGLAPEECEVFLKGRHPAYISWEQFEANRARLEANRSRAEIVGAVRSGAALLAGVVRRGLCGERMYVRYRDHRHRPTYVCSTPQSDYSLPLCQAVSSAEDEARVAEEVLVALQPAALEASIEAASQVDVRRRQWTRDWDRRIERARYEADRARRQYVACEPENRLVARALERRWDETLRAVRELEQDFERFQGTQPRSLDHADLERLRHLAVEVPALWDAPTRTPADRREILRLLIDRVVPTVGPGDDRLAVRVEWAGGVVRERALQKTVQGYKNQQQWDRLSARLDVLHGLGESPKAIAAALDREGFRPPKQAAGFTARMARRLLHELGLRRRGPRQGGEVVLRTGERWLHELAQDLGVSPHTLHGWRKRAGSTLVNWAAGEGPGPYGPTQPNGPASAS